MYEVLGGYKLKSKIKGILVGCDDLYEGGYEWVINHNDWDNGNTGICNKLKKYKNQKEFKIYFYAFKTTTETPASTSDEFRGTIFGIAKIENVELYKNDPDQDIYPHHVKLKNFKLFEPKIKLDDIEDGLEKYGWTDGQIENNPFANNLRHHGLLLTEKDCDLINNLTSNNNTKKINGNNAINKTEDVIEMENDVKNDGSGLLVGFKVFPERSGFEYVLDHCEESGRNNKGLLSLAKSMIGKKCYFYIFSLNPTDWDDEKLLDEYLDSYFSIIHGGKNGIFEKIFGEGLIENVIQENDGQYIIFKYVTHYRKYINIDDVKKLSNRMKSNGWNKSIIRLGLPLTQEECNEISYLAGVT